MQQIYRERHQGCRGEQNCMITCPHGGSIPVEERPINLISNCRWYILLRKEKKYGGWMV